MLNESLMNIIMNQRQIGGEGWARGAASQSEAYIGGSFWPTKVPGKCKFLAEDQKLARLAGEWLCVSVDMLENNSEMETKTWSYIN